MATSRSPHVAAWREKPGGWPTSSNGASDPVITYPTVELFLNEQWVDVTSYVRYDAMINISRGRSSESNQTDPSACTFTINNRDGRFSPRNPVGPYYGYIGRNTPVRVSVVRNGVRRYRFYGEISSWPVKWDISGHDVWVEIEAAGVTRRIGQGSAQLRSAIFREMNNPTRQNIVAYWPLEDPSGADFFGSGIAGKPAMQYTGTPTFATSEVWPGSDPLPEIATAILTGPVNPYTDTGEVAIRFLMYAPATVASDTLIASYRTTGTTREWRIYLSASGTIKLIAYDIDGTSVLDTGAVFYGAGVTGELANVLLELTQDGSDTDYRLNITYYTDVTSINTGAPGFSSTGTLAGYTFGKVNKIVIGAGTLDQTVIGHITVANLKSAYSSTGNSLIGWRGEAASVRMPRLSSEQGVNFQVVSNGVVGNTVTLGQQDSKGYLDLLRESAATDLGYMYEPRDQLGISYRTRLSMYNQSPKLTLDYSQHQLSQPPIPVDDDRYVVNDVTVSRDHGSIYVTELDTGDVSVLDPPNGVGRYAQQFSISLGTDDQLADQAGWRLHAGTIDEARFPNIDINLRHSTFTSSVDMMNSALVTDIGDRIVITNPPSWLPPDQITQVVIGHSETLGILEHDITFYCVPESVFHASYVEGSSYERADTDGSTLTSDIDSTATSMSVTTQAGSAPWVDSITYPEEFPFDVIIGGEIINVVGIGASGLILNSNPTFETGTTSWTATNATIQQSSTVSKGGSYSCMLTSSSGSSPRAEDSQRAVTAGNTYVAAGWLYAPLPLPTDATVSINWYDAAHTYLSTSTTLATLTPGVWTAVSGDFAAPATAAFAGLHFSISGTPGSGYVLFADNLVLLDDTAVDSTSPQNFYVTRSVNGVVKAQLAGADIRLADPAIISL